MKQLQMRNIIPADKVETPSMSVPLRRRLTNGMIWMKDEKMPNQPGNAYEHWKDMNKVPQVIPPIQAYDTYPTPAPKYDPYSKDYFEMRALNEVQNRQADLADKSETGVFNFIEAIEESSRRGTELLKGYERTQFAEKVERLRREGFSNEEINDYLKKHRMETMEQLFKKVEVRPNLAMTLRNSMGDLNELTHQEAKSFHAMLNSELQLRNVEQREMGTSPIKSSPVRPVKPPRQSREASTLSEGATYSAGIGPRTRSRSNSVASALETLTAGGTPRR